MEAYLEDGKRVRSMIHSNHGDLIAKCDECGESTEGVSAIASDRDALYAAILAAPDDDAPRLIFADELEEDQPERAEFIRVQCELASRQKERRSGCLCDDDDARPRYCPQCERDKWTRSLVERSRALLRQHGEAWAMAELVNPCGIDFWKQVPDNDRYVERRIKPQHWSRGMIETVELDCATLMGRECERCGGHGTTRRTARSREEMDAINAGVWMCPICHGSGRVGGCREALARAVPVMKVVLTGKRPQNRSIPLKWAWSFVNPYADNPNYQHWLPSCLMPFFENVNTRGAINGGTGFVEFDSGPAALAALATAAAAFVRRGGRT